MKCFEAQQMWASSESKRVKAATNSHVGIFCQKPGNALDQFPDNIAFRFHISDQPIFSEVTVG